MDPFTFEYKSSGSSSWKTAYFDLVARFEAGANIPSTSSVTVFKNEETLTELVSSIHRDINANKPAAALDRFHTYCVKKIKFLIEQYGSSCAKDEPLHSLMGKYIKLVSNSREFSEMSIRILKSNISIFEKFNDIRNHASFAHDNSIVNQEEATYIFESVSATLRFIRAIEKDKFG
jgi:hypothetical protein